jgi:AcrR family transcriptional regulator
MGKLIDREKLKRAKRERGEKKKRIQVEARDTLLRMPFVEVTIDTIGQAAGVERGIASMFFRTREELYLIIVREELEEWFDALEHKLKDFGAPAQPDEIVGLVAVSLADRPDLTRLLSLLPVVLEQNVEAMEVFRFQKWRLDRGGELGKLIEKLAPGFGSGSGFKIVYMAQVLASGLEPVAHPRGSAAYDRGDPDFEAFWLNLGDELQRLLLATIQSE